MKAQGNLLKMTSLLSDPVQYSIMLGGVKIFLNELIGKEITLKYLNQINCIKCGSITNKSFAQGFCYPCFRSAPEAEECILRPELCRAHEGVARDMEFATRHCLIDHYVYLSFTSGVKVGVTRSTQLPTRWIDQGATQAVKLAKTPNRHLAGCIEVALKAHFNDKTNWIAMLKSDSAVPDLRKYKEKAAAVLPEEYRKFLVKDSQAISLNYPLPPIIEKLKSLSFDKMPIIKGKLFGIKGQYFVFENGQVLNIRKHGGYLVELSY